jgi:SAM-dependent methyltransferase
MKQWCNVDNIAFYNQLPFDEFYKAGAESGLNNGCDIKAIAHYVKRAQSILEVGAGYGRVITHILDMGYAGKLVALERDPALCQLLKTQFNKKITVIQKDILAFHSKFRFDLIVWMWASFSEFSKTEQLSALDRVTKHLEIKGYLILDIVPLSCKTTNTVDFNSQDKVIQTPFGDDYIYLPSPAELESYQKKLNLKKIETITYQTQTNKNRYLEVFQKI